MLILVLYSPQTTHPGSPPFPPLPREGRDSVSVPNPVNLSLHHLPHLSLYHKYL